MKKLFLKRFENIARINRYNSDTPIDSADKGNRLEKQIIAMMLQFPAILPAIKMYNVIEYFESDTLKSIGKTILDKQLSSEAQISELLTSIADPVQENLIATL